MEIKPGGVNYVTQENAGVETIAVFDELSGQTRRITLPLDQKAAEAAALAEREAAHQDETAALVAERGSTHGDFIEHARITQDIKQVMYREAAARRERGQPDLTDTQKEALEMIAHKIGRILAGDASFKDHWDDIAGYARITSERL